MVKRGRRRAAAKAIAKTVAFDFARGFVATALVSLLQDRGARPVGVAELRRILRHAVHGGIALSAGTIAAQAALRRDFAILFAAVAGGAAGMVAIEHFFNGDPI